MILLWLLRAYFTLYVLERLCPYLLLLRLVCMSLDLPRHLLFELFPFALMLKSRLSNLLLAQVEVLLQPVGALLGQFCLRLLLLYVHFG